MSTDLKGMKELRKSLKQFPQNIQRNVVNGAVRAGGKPLILRARELVPVDTFALEKSIKIKKMRSKKGSTVTHYAVYTKLYYAHIIEFGSSKAPAYPFMRPALEQEADKSIVFFKDYMQKRIQKEIAKAKK